MHAPTEDHLAAAKHVLRYLRNTSDLGILLSASSASTLTGYCDSDWGSCHDSRKSTTGFCMLLGSSPISWKVKKQTVVVDPQLKLSTEPWLLHAVKSFGS